MEATCQLEWNGKSGLGKLHLDSQHLTVSGPFRAQITLAGVGAARAAHSILTVSWQDGILYAHIGTDAAKWADKILNPPTRMTKLGIKANSRVALVDLPDEPLLSAELATLPASAVRLGQGTADFLLFHAPSAEALKRIPELSRALSPQGVLWVIYPKGVKIITESQVMAAAKQYGFSVPKTCSFSSELTGLKLTKAKAAIPKLKI